MKKREKSPCQVEFSEERVELVNDGCQQQRHTYQLQNRGPGSVRVRAAIGADSDHVFVLLSSGEEKYVAPGLKLPVVLQYSPKGDDEACHHCGSLEVFVNSSLSLTIPISAVPRSPRLHLSEEVVDVGCLVTENQIHTTSFSLSNLGTREGAFFIDTSPLPGCISLQPTTGHLLPLQSTRIQLEILCKEEIEFSYALRISTSAPPTAVDTPAANTGGEGEEEEKAAPSLLLTVCGRLESRALRVLDPLSLSSLPSLSFPPTYYDTTTSRQVILFNESPVSTDYLCLLDKRARGSGVGGAEGVAMALTEGGPGQERWREQGSTPPHESIISVLPSQGTLLPYEKRKLELTFAPRFVSSDSGWSHFQATPTRRDYTLYLRFLAVDTNRESTASGGDLEVAVCATALPVDVQLEPSPPLQFGATPTMSPITQHVKVHNKSDTLPLYFTTHRVPHYTCHPPSGHIPPSPSLQSSSDHSMPDYSSTF
ncbi:Cilia- and flagella-associated protein 47 [Geodia barretti]|uniref:Cilia- and flagella-associated protein 47 n=1 Tax=Geodia barretti TaxID=519541 RepID=A0AA35WFZ7_GEOBA|nr:Cilia- and flagella-associated protein 47 [Geodia barretti]